MTMIRPLTLALSAVLMLAPPASAGDDFVPPITDATVLKECGECHMAFQPAFLPARSWTRMMDGLADHFGENATLPAVKADRIRAYLTAHAGDVDGRGEARKFMRGIASGQAPLRITENPRFEREHRFPDRVWKDPKVVARSNCPACHTGAERGWYEDD